ncbi:MOSC domain-containing protein [Aquimarina addita]|uniref:MOSC domain-containing protein n=1 Tax=Aquimarina addita TaxID=870485 RepID=A0ABP7XG25_9FLAO
MKIISTNIGTSQIISWRGKKVKTGIFKYPVNEPVYLDIEDVKNDHVMDRRFHGGVDKACYLYAADHYPFWKNKYPDLEWNYGMFGENLTVLGLDERLMKIGSIYRLGDAIVQVSQPRQPCYKLGVRFGTQKVLKEFINSLFPGIYVRVLSAGYVRKGDILTIEKEHIEGLSINQMYRLLYDQTSHPEWAKRALNDPFVVENNKEVINKRYKKII